MHCTSHLTASSNGQHLYQQNTMSRAASMQVGDAYQAERAGTDLMCYSCICLHCILHLMASSIGQHRCQENTATSMQVCDAYQAERAGADFNPGLPVGSCHPHAILHDGDHGTFLLLLHILLLWAGVCRTNKDSQCDTDCKVESSTSFAF